MKTVTRVVVGMSAAALVATPLAMPASAADTLTPMDATMLQQMVLRAQMPKTLGAWSQNLYQAYEGGTPAVCWTVDGKEIQLPKATSTTGLVGYDIGQNTNGAVTVFQYATQADADAALKGIRDISCPGTFKMAEEGGELRPATSGSDFTDGSMTGMEINATFTDSNGRKNVSDRITTQVGLAVVQTTTFTLLEKNAKQAAVTKAVNEAESTNRAWHKQVLKAYRAFGIAGRAS